MLTNKDAKMFDYDLIDRVVKAVAIDTEKHQSLYHHLIYKQIPNNLRPHTYYKYYPMIFNQKLNSSKLIQGLKNRSLYN